MNENMFYHSSSKLIRNYYSALLFAMFFVLPPPCTPIFTVLYPAGSQTCPLSLWYCNSWSLLIWTCNQSKSIEQSVLLTNESTMFRAIQFVHWTVYSLQCSVLQYTILKGTKIRGVNMWSMCFFLSLDWVRPEHFVDITSNIVPPEATGEEASCVPYPALTWFLTYITTG